jgi:hypothetical protein
LTFAGFAHQHFTYDVTTLHAISLAFGRAEHGGPLAAMILVAACQTFMRFHFHHLCVFMDPK